MTAVDIAKYRARAIELEQRRKAQRDEKRRLDTLHIRRKAAEKAQRKLRRQQEEAALAAIEARKQTVYETTSAPAAAAAATTTTTTTTTTATLPAAEMELPHRESPEGERLWWRSHPSVSRASPGAPADHTVSNSGETEE